MAYTLGGLGQSGGATVIARSDGEPMQGKDKQFIPHGVRVAMAFPGGGGYGDPSKRDRASIEQDIAQGYITPEYANKHYNVSVADAAKIIEQSTVGDS